MYLWVVVQFFQMTKKTGSRCSSASFEDRVQVLEYSDDEVELRHPPGKRSQESEDKNAKSKLMNILRKSSLSSLVCGFAMILNTQSTSIFGFY